MKRNLLNFAAVSAIRRRNLRLRIQEESTLGYLLVSPAFVFLLLLLAYPLILAIYLSLTDKRFGAVPNFVGLQNYINLAQTPRFWSAVQASLVYTIAALIFKFVGGLAVALLINRAFVGRRLVRAVLLLPWIVPTVFSSLAWLWMLDPAFGIINVALKRWGLIQTNIPFLINPTLAMACLVAANVWRGVPFFAITFLAGLQTVPDELIDAAKIDGASSWRTLLSITLPMIMPVVVIVMLISTIGTIADFELPFILTRGGPGTATQVFGIMTYNLSIESGLYGLGTAVSMAMFPFLALLVVLSLVRLRRED
jgi:multiple sugar transport system permease protein